MLARLLGEEGYYVTCATRTADACEVLERVKVDLLIADVLLPDGTCFAAVDIAERKDVPYFLMTGCPEQMAQLRANGDFHLSKPFRLLAFVDEVRDWMRCAIGSARATVRDGIGNSDSAAWRHSCNGRRAYKREGSEGRRVAKLGGTTIGRAGDVCCAGVARRHAIRHEGV
jgi:DNA-binding response OmpR family regulator